MPKPNVDNSKFHHYVPQFLLKKFCFRSKKRQYYVKVFDKSRRRIFESNVNQICGETDFNRVKLDAGDFCFEGTTQAIDDLGARVIGKLLSSRRLELLSTKERGELLIFIALQLVRGTGARNMAEDAFQQLRSLLTDRFGEENLPDEIRVPTTPEERKLFDLSLMVRSLNETALALAHKVMVLLVAPPNYPLLLSDNPVTISNSLPSNGPWSNLGILCEGSELYMPLTPYMTLALWCPITCERIDAKISEIKNDLKKSEAAKTLVLPHIARQISEQQDILKQCLQYLGSVSECTSGKNLLDMSHDNVLHQNSLQVSHAERFIISLNGDFGLVNEMLDTDPKFVRGRRMLVG